MSVMPARKVVETVLDSTEKKVFDLAPEPRTAATMCRSGRLL